MRKFVVHGDDIFGLGTDNAIWRTTIYGTPSSPKNWTKVTDGSVTEFEVYRGRFYGVGTDGAIWTHQKSGWGSWQRITSGTVSQIQIHDDKIYGLGTDNAVWEHPLEQHNRGWTRVTTGNVSYFVVNPHNDRFYGIGMEKDVFAHDLPKPRWMY